MSNTPDERRVFHALRDHVDCLLAAGASITGRDPVRLSLKGHTLTVQQGMLVNENGYQDLIETLADYQWSDKRTRNVAIDLCIQQVDRAIDQACLSCLDDPPPKQC
ncbi:hypothetical protein N8H22_18560 [Stutzerimonas stutzeri]|uniref:hypothetical protein n=1 Tax=Stutzerimonas sp. S1 TaxID=3030652 RepID=UPI002224189F|nr:hypothetical protein [Stutzerimonas sp. S1]